MPSDYIEKNSVIPLFNTPPVIDINEPAGAAKHFAKKALEQYDDIMEDKRLAAELNDPWD